MDTKKILIVDDEPDVLFILEKELAGRGYSVISADNGSDAIALTKSERPDLIVLDVVMPDMGGAEIAESLRESPENRDVPIIFLTGLLSKKEEEQRGRVFAGNVFIAKPYDIEKLSIEIERLIGWQRVHH